MLDVDDDAPLPGEDAFYDLVSELEQKARELSDTLGLSNEDLQKLEARWLKIGKNQEGMLDGYVVAHAVHHALLSRRLGQLVSMMKPGESMVPLVELRDRFDRNRGDA